LHKVYVTWILLRSEPHLYLWSEESAVSIVNAPNSKPKDWLLVVLAWLPVTIPLLWGIWQTVKKAAVLFR
jgi:hypothetical protein